jgi:precorrin-3B synthase
MAGVPLLDRCPGVLRPHQAEDGLVVRLRIPGGQTTAEVLSALCRLAAAYRISPGGAGYVQLTSRGNLQLRGLDGTRLAELTQEIFALGLLPSFAHDRVRNIVASPLTGLEADRPDLRPMVGELDAALCAEPRLAELPGRFLFALDDGRGEVSSLAFDLGYRAVDHDHGLLLVGGPSPRGRLVARSDAVPTIIDLAREVVRRRASIASPGWRVWELPGLADGLPEIALPAGATVPLGAVSGAASVKAPLGLLTAAQVRAIEAVTAGRPVVVTPWRGLVVVGAADSLGSLARSGLIVDDTSHWSMITACIGAPGCARSLIDTRALAAALVDRGAPNRPIHLSGCSRRCGAPNHDHLDLVAPSLDEALARVGVPAHA